MELLQLKYFLELARYEHLTKVAEMMYISPSAISSSISRLEKELGVDLFDRVGRNIHLNRYGKIYYNHVKRALEELEDGKKEIYDLASSSETYLTLATTNPYIWNKPIQKFISMYPNISFKTFAFDSIASGTKTPKENLDLLIASPQSFSDPAWDSVTLFNDNVALAVPPSHPLASKKTISLIEAKDELFVNLPDSSFSRFCHNLCLTAGFEPKSIITCDYTLRPKIALSEGMVLLTTFNCKSSEIFANLVFLPIQTPDIKRSQAIFWPKSRYLSQSAKLFRDFLVELYQDYVPYEL